MTEEASIPERKRRWISEIRDVAQGLIRIAERLEGSLKNEPLSINDMASYLHSLEHKFFNIRVGIVHQLLQISTRIVAKQQEAPFPREEIQIESQQKRLL